MPSNPVIVQCSLIRNRADGSGNGDGGAILVDNGSSPKIVNCSLFGNYASHVGGGLSVRRELEDAAGLTTVVNSIFVGNMARDSGGGVRIGGDGARARLLDCTIIANEAGPGHDLFVPGGGGVSKGGDLDEPDDDDNLLANCIVWGNNASDGSGSVNGMQVNVVGTGAFFGHLKIADSDVQDNTSDSGVYVDPVYAALTWTGTRLDADPLLTTTPDGGSDGWGTGYEDYGDLRLQATSPCINFGNCSYVPEDAADLDGDSVTTDATPLDLSLVARSVAEVDMGAFEFQTCNGDATHNGVVNIDDLLAVTNHWGTCSAHPCIGDVSPIVSGACANGVVNMDDLLIVINAWGDCPGPEGEGRAAPSGEEGQGGGEDDGIPSWLQDCIDFCEGDGVCMVDCINEHFETP